MDKVKRFMKYEDILFKVELFIVGTGVFFIFLFWAFLDSIGSLAEAWITVFMLGWGLVILNFFITLIRVLRYLFSIKKLEGEKSIWKSMVILLLSPIGFIVYYILIFVAALSSCSA